MKTAWEWRITMKYHTINELDHFCFKEAYIAQICAVNGMFEIVFDNVTILPENSCNRDIREMRANELVLKISEPKIEALVEEGYKVYDANGNLKQKNEDITIAPEAYADKFKELEGCEVYSIEQENGNYVISIDTEDHTFLLRVSGSGDTQEWDRFLNK